MRGIKRDGTWTALGKIREHGAKTRLQRAELGTKDSIGAISHSRKSWGKDRAGPAQIWAEQTEGTNETMGMGCRMS